MIIKAEIINQPQSGKYEEKIYDILSFWNSHNWTWVKFTNDDFNEWCGEFRGEPKAVAISTKFKNCLILTSDHLYQINCQDGELIGYDKHTQYRNLTVTPLGDFLIANFYSIEILYSKLTGYKLNSPIEMDFIEFHDWIGNKLRITCEELYDHNNVELEFDCSTLELIKKTL